MFIQDSIRKFLNAFGYEITKIKNISIGISVEKWIYKLNIETIIDVGSNEGQFIKSIIKVLPNKKIIAFEPIESVYKRLLLNTRGMNVTAYNIGLSDENRTAKINISKNFDSSSMLNMEEIHKRIYPESEYTSTETVQLKRLDDFIDIENISRNILLKIDVQGYENKVLAGASKVIREAAMVIIEFSFEPIYEGQWLFDETFSYFRDNGFKFIGLSNQTSNDVIGVPLFGDAIFVRKDLAKQLYA